MAVPDHPITTVARFNELAAGYRYEKGALDARIEETADMPGWRREKLSFSGAGGERAIAYLYLPHHVARPLQVLHFVPAGDVAGGFRSLDSSMDDRMAPFVLAGRAAFGVVLKGYIGRLRPAGSIPPSATTVEFAESSMNQISELRRGLDYLESRPDVDPTRIGFFGPSAGAAIGLILTAVEDRYRAITMVGAGLPREWVEIVAEANPIHFAPHIRAPKLLVQGRYDEDTHLRTAAEPLFKLWPEPKRLVVYEGGHVPTNEVLMNATRDWLDEVMGPVRR
jgi:dienelactone hydrolase